MDDLGNVGAGRGLAIDSSDAALGTEVARETHRVARVLSNLLSPPALAFGVFWVLARAFAPGRVWQVLAVCLLAQSVLPVLYLKWAVRRGSIGDVDMSRRAERKTGLPFLGLVYVLGCVVAVAAKVPGGPLVVALGSVLVLGAVWLVNLVYKASGHIAGAAAYMTALSLLVQPVHPGWLILPALAWARVRIGAHTVAQTLWGFAIGAATTWLIYHLLYVPFLS
jgi:hypothetical protein